MSDPNACYVRHFVACNKCDMGQFAPLFIDGRRFGYVTTKLAGLLPRETRLFVPHADGIALDAKFNSYAARSEALMQATKWIAARYEKNLRNEKYAVVEKWGDTPIAEIDRVAVPWFGVRAWGVHVNGYVRKADGIYLWVGTRADDRPADPGKLDNLIGGGQPIGLSERENLCKEAKEEAGIEEALAMTAKLARTMDYRMQRSDGLRTDTLFIYDLELPQDFVPQNTDGEVARFDLMPLREVAAIVRDTNKFKFNCNLVIIDFLMRHGFITAQDDAHTPLAKWLE